MKYTRSRLPIMVQCDVRLDGVAKDRMVTLLNAAAVDHGQRYDTEPLLEEGWLLYGNTTAPEFEAHGRIWSIVINETGDEPKYALPCRFEVDDGDSVTLTLIESNGSRKILPIRGLIDPTFLCVVRL